MGDSELQSDIQTLKVSEVFYSLQGEGGRAGEPSIFIRLSGCSAKHACYQSGVVCDTEFESGNEMTLESLLENMLIQEFISLNPTVKVKHIQMLQTNCKWIVWTGGEPLDQLTPEIASWFRERGYKQAIETSGIRPFSFDFRHLFDYITCSPKVAEHILVKHFDIKSNPAPGWEPIVDELRYVRHSGQPGVPEPELTAQHYYLSPHSDGSTINQENLRHCIKLCLENPKWALSVQQHKLWNVL